MTKRLYAAEPTMVEGPKAPAVDARQPSEVAQPGEEKPMDSEGWSLGPQRTKEVAPDHFDQCQNNLRRRASQRHEGAVDPRQRARGVGMPPKA
jgi:hypothetical protein